MDHTKNYVKSKLKKTSYSVYVLESPNAKQTPLSKRKKSYAINKFNFGALGLSSSISSPFNFDKHKKEYGDIAQGVIDYIQKRLVKSYGLEEVMVPEKKVLKDLILQKYGNKIKLNCDFK